MTLGITWTGISLGLEDLADHQGSFRGNAKLWGLLRSSHSWGALDHLSPLGNASPSSPLKGSLCSREPTQ